MGISATVGGLATSVYYLYGNMTVADVLPEDKDLQDALGDMKDMSAEDFVGLMKRWLDAPDSFDISDLEAKYGFSTVDLINKLAGGSSDPDDEKNVIKKTDENQPYIDDLKSVSIFSLLSGKVGFKEFMADVPTGAVLAFIPSDKFLDNTQREKLRKYSLGQLISTDEVKNQPGILTALSDLTFGGMLPGVFEENGGVYTVKEGKPQALNLLANIQFGGIFDVVTGSSDIGTELVEGGLSPIGEMKVGDFLIDLGVSKEGDELPDKLNSIFGGMEIRDLFEKDVTTNKYKFVVDRLLDRIEIGSIMGYAKNENGVWVSKSDDGETEVNGLLGYLADLNLTDVYHAFADEGTIEQKIHNFLLVFGDLSVGDIFETLKYTKDENGVWKKPNGDPVKSELLKSLMDFTIEDIVGDKDSELTGKQIRLNIVESISELAGDDLTIAKGLGEIFKLKFDEDGNPVKDDNGYYLDENGESVGVFKTRLFDIKFKDLATAFGGDKVELDNIYGVFEEALGGVTLGNILGMTYGDGTWKNKDGGEITGIVSLLYDLRFGGVFSLVRELENSKEFSFSNVIRGFLPDASIGDIIVPLLGYSKVGEGNEVRYYDKNGEKVEDGLGTVLLLKLWQIAAGFDKNAEYSLKEEIKDIRLGEVFNGKREEDSYGNPWWTIGGRMARGALADLLDVTLEHLFMTKEELDSQLVEGMIKNISLGSVLAFALKYEYAEGDNKYGTILDKDEEINGVFDAFILWDFITFSNITGGAFKDKELLHEELNAQFGDFMLGETFRPFAAEILGDGTYNFKLLEQASGVVNILFNTSYQTIFDFVFSEDKDFIQFIVDVLGETTIGDVIAPVVGMKKVDNAYVLGKGEGKSLGVAISAILDTQIGKIITLLTDKEDDRTITQKLLGGKANEDGLIDLDYMLGQYVETFLDFEYRPVEGKWYKGDKAIYAPVSRLLSVNMFDLLDHLLSISQEYTSDEKKDYLFGILDGITIGDLLDPVLDKVEKLKDKQLIKLISDIVLVDTKEEENKGLVCDLMDADKDKLEVVEHYFGGIKLGYIAELLTYAEETDEAKHTWKKEDGSEYPVMLGDIFSVSVGYILDIVKNRTGEENLVVNIVNEIFPQRRVGDLVAMIITGFKDDCDKDGVDEKVWGLNGNAMPLVVSDVFNFKIASIFDIVLEDNDAITKVTNATDELFGERTIGQYFKDFGINDFSDESSSLIEVGNTEVAEFIRGILGKVANPLTGENYTTVEYLKKVVGGVIIRDVAGLAVKSLKTLERPHILADVISLKFGDVFDVIDAVKDDNLKGGVYGLLNKITKGDARTLGDYVDDILRGENDESIIKKNLGIKGLTNIEIAKLVGLILKVDGIEVEPNEGVKKFGVEPNDLAPIINYVLNITDSVLIGDFLRNSDGSGYRLEDGKWYDKDGNACKDALNTVFNAPTSYVLYLIYGIMNPKLISDAVKALKVGTVLMPIYNALLTKAFNGSEIVVNDKDAKEEDKVYEINGAFRDLLTELANKTIGEVIDDLTGEGKKPLEVVKGYVLDRPLGDILFDILAKFLGEKLKLNGFAYENVTSGKYDVEKKALGAIFDLNVNELLGSEDKLEYIKNSFKHLALADFAAIALDNLSKKDGDRWYNGEKKMPLIVSDLFDVTIENLLDIKGKQGDDLILHIVKTIFHDRNLKVYLADLNQDTIDKYIEKEALQTVLTERIVDLVDYILANKKQPTEIVSHYFGGATIGQLAQIVLDKLFPATATQSGARSVRVMARAAANKKVVWANDGKDMPLIVSDLFNVTVDELLDIKDNKDNLAEYLIETICGDKRTLKEYLVDLKNDKITEIANKEVLKPLLTDPILNIVKTVKEKKSEPLEIVRKYLGEATVGAIAQIALSELAKNADGTWSNKGTAMKLIVSDLFNVTVNQLLDAKDKKGKDMITYLVETICKERTVGDYLSDLNMEAVNKIIEKDVLDKIVDEKVIDLVNRLIGEGKLDEKIRYYLGDATIGAIAQVAMSNLDREGKDRWYNGEKAMPLIVSDLFDLTVNNLFGVLDAKKDGNMKKGIYDLVNLLTKNDTHNLNAYLDDILKGNKESSIIKDNPGIDGLTQIEVAKLVGLLLKVDGITVEPNEGVKKFVDPTTLPSIVNYVLNITDKVLIGDFLRTNADGKSGYTKVDGKWYDKNGNECKEIIGKVLNLRSSYILYAAYAVMKPKVVIDAISDYKLGALLKPVYNMAMEKVKFDSKIVGDGYQSEQTVNGAFKAVMEDIANVTVKELYDSIATNKDFATKAKEMLLNRPIGDYAFDLLKKFVGEKLKLEGFAYENVVDDKYATKKEALNVIFNINIKELLNASDKIDFLKEKAGELSVGAIAQIALAELDKNADGTWSNKGTAMKLIVSDLFNVTVNQLLDIKDNKDNLPEYLVNTICGEKRTLRQYLDDLKNDNVDKITKKEVLDTLLDDPIVNIVKVVKENKKEPLKIVKHYFGDAKVGELAQIAMSNLKEEGGLWANGEKKMPLIASDVFNVTLNALAGARKKQKTELVKHVVKTICGEERTLRHYLDDLNKDNINKITEKAVLGKLLDDTIVNVVEVVTKNVKEPLKIVKHYFGDAKVGELAQIAMSNLKEEGGLWTNGEKKMPLIASDVFNVTLNALAGARKKQKTELVKYVVKTICGEERTLRHYLDDLDKDNIDKITEKAVLGKLLDDTIVNVVEVVTDNIKAPKEIVVYYFGEARVGDLAQIAMETLAVENGVWSKDDKPMKLIVSDLFNVTVNELLDVKDNKDNLAEYLVKTVCGEERTLRHYLDDLDKDNINKITEKKVLNSLLDDPVVNVVKVVKANKDKPTEIVKHYFGKAKVGELAGIAMSKLEETEDGWTNNKKALPLIVSDIFDLTVNEVGAFVKNIKNKEKIVEFVGKVTKDDAHTLNVYLEDILKKKITNKGLKELSDIKIAEFASVALKVNDFEVPASKELEKFKIDLKTMDGVSKYADAINYVLNITDNVMLGYFKIKVDENGNESGIYLRIEDGKKVWYNEKGEKVSSGMSTVYSIPSSYVLFAVAALAMPGKIIEAVGDYRIGGLIQSVYNKAMTKFDSKIVGSDKKGEFTVEGSFKAVMEDVSNVTVKQIYNALLKDKNFTKKAKEMLLERPLGDYAYDLIRVLSKEKLCKGFAYEHTDDKKNYVIDGSLSAVLEATFNVKVNDLLSAVKKGIKGIKQLAKDTYKDFTVGDFTYDVFKKYAAKKVKLTANGTAKDYKNNNLVLTGKMAKVFRATFDMKITEATSITEKLKVKNGVLDFVKAHYGKLSLGDAFGAIAEKFVKKPLKVEFNYDAENDYALTISGNYNEVFGAVFASNLGDLIDAYKNRTTVKYFLDEKTGVIGGLPLGDVLAYVCKSNSLKKQMKYTEIAKAESGEWTVNGAYEKPLGIAFNQLTIGKVYAERAKFENNIIKPYFGEVKVGELMGGRYDEANDVWLKPNGKVVSEEGANAVIMNRIYALTLNEVTKSDFQVVSVFDDIYAGEVLGYYHCGYYKYTTDETENRYDLCDSEDPHKDYEYHVHDDGDMYSKKSEFVTEVSGIKLCNDTTHTDENHKWHYHDEIVCKIKSHTDTTHTMGGWYKDKEGTVKANAIENAFANVRLGHLMGGSFEFSDIVRGVKLGEAMDMVRCGGSDDTCDITDTTHEHKTGVWYKFNETTNAYETSGVLLDRIADRDLGDIFDNGLDLGETFDGVLLGDVMGYKYCNGASDCTYKDVDPTHTHIASGSKKVWYVLDDKGTPDASDDVYNRATTLETILANVSMRSVIDGDFSIETQIKNVRIGELMSYEYCDGTNECLPHGNGTHAEGWYRNDSGTWTKITDNLILCVADFTITDIRKDDFGTKLSEKVKTTVTVGDIFDTQSGPLSLISSDTKVGDISTAVQTAIEDSTAIDLFNAGVLPIKSDNGANSTAPGGTLEKLDSTFDTIRPHVVAGGLDMNKDGTIEIAISFTANEKAKAKAAESVTTEDRVTYQIADGYEYEQGRKFWGSLKLEEMVDVLLSVVTATVQ